MKKCEIYAEYLSDPHKRSFCSCPVCTKIRLELKEGFQQARDIAILKSLGVKNEM